MPTSTARCVAGSTTSSTATATRSPRSTAGFACVCGAFFANVRTQGAGTGAGSSSLAECLLCRARVVQSESRPCTGRSILSEVKPSTGEPDAGNPPVRFGGRGDRTQSVFPTPIILNFTSRVAPTTRCRCCEATRGFRATLGRSGVASRSLLALETAREFNVRPRPDLVRL